MAITTGQFMRQKNIGFLFVLIVIPLFFLQLAVLGAQEEGDDFYNEDLLLFEGEGLTVTESPETTQQMKVIDKSEIAKRNSQDLAELLQDVLDLGTTRYGAYGNRTNINMRGFDSERIAFLIDGVPVNSPMAGEFEISQIDPDSIERIEVVYGGSDTKYNVSGALGGVINIITVKKEQPGLHVSGSISNTSAMPGQYQAHSGEMKDPHWEDLLDSQNLSFSGSYGAEKYSVAASVFANRAENHFLYRNRILDKTWRKENNEVRDSGAKIAFIRNLPDYTKFIVSGDIYYGDKSIPTSGTSTIAGTQKDFTTRQNLMLDMPRAFNDALATEASVTHSWQKMDYEPPSGSVSQHDEHTITGINRWSWYPSEKLTLRMGGDYRYVFLDSTDMGFHDRHDGGLYLTAEFQLHQRFLIVPSIKGVFSGPHAGMPAVAVPKLGFLWKATDSVTFKNNYFRSFKHPDFESLYWSGGGGLGNPDLKPEDGWGSDLGVAYHYKDRLDLETTFFAQWTKDSIHWANTGNNIWKPENVGKAAYFGDDIRAKIIFPFSQGIFKEISFSFSYQFILSYLLSDKYTWESNKRIPYMPMHTIGASIELSWKTGSVLLSGHYEAKRYIEGTNTNVLNPNFLLNLNLTQRINKNLSSSLALRNILNTSYESFDDCPMPGFTATIGMRINIEPGNEKKSE
jgi:vitamin B12 transporter